MTSFGVLLAVVALLDVLRPARGRRVAIAALAAAIAATAGAYATGHAPAVALLLGASVLVVEVPAWTYVRRSRRSPVALAVVVAALLARLVTTPLWDPDAAGIVGEWAAEMPFALASIGTARITFVVGTACFLSTAANTLVRLLLSSVPGVDFDSGDRLPGGGRIIGSLERLLIFGLALAGEATAAALVVSAKGVLRFAEVRATPGEDVDRVTEYVLVGSLASYALAMAFVPLALP